MEIKIFVYQMEQLVTKELMEYKSTWSFQPGSLYQIGSNDAWWRVKKIVNIEIENIKQGVKH